MGALSGSSGRYEHVDFVERAAWRVWLESNHGDSRGVWVLLFKRSAGTPTMGYDESVEEALCFGWVDSRKKKGG